MMASSLLIPTSVSVERISIKLPIPPAKRPALGESKGDSFSSGEYAIVSISAAALLFALEKKYAA